MKTVGRLGSYITKGVYTVSGSLHPFGGAVDIIVVEQPDGSFKSSPWYVRFGKFQGVLKAKDKVVKIAVNGVEANFHMYLDPRGEAYFLREVEEGEPVLSPTSSSDETDSGPLKTLRSVKSEGYNSDSVLSNSGSRIDGCDGKIVVRSTSRRSKIMGMVFGRKSVSTKDDSFQEVDDSTGIPRMGSLERAEIAANLLELQWSTNLATSKSKKNCRLPPFLSQYTVDSNLQLDSSVRANSTEKIQSSILAEVVDSSNDKIPTISSISNKTSQRKDISEAINTEAQRLGSGELCGEMDVPSPVSGIPGQDNGSNKVHSFFHWETSQGLEVELDGLKERNHDTLFFSGAEQEEVIAYSQSEARHITSQDNADQQNVNFGLMADEGLNLEMAKAVLDPDTPATFTLKIPLLEAVESVCIDNTSNHVSSDPVSENSEEEHHLFGDLNELRPKRVLKRSDAPNSMYIESSRGINESSTELVSSSGAGRLSESMPSISSHIDSLNTGLHKSSSYSSDLSSKPVEWTLRQDDSGFSHVDSGDPSKEISPSGGSRRVSPLYQKQLGSRRTFQSALNDTWSFESANASDAACAENLGSPENDSSSSVGVNADNGVFKPKVAKKMARVTTPTSEQIASLNLQEGKNIVTFTFSTPMLGKQEVDARIFLWKWNTRIVISDVDGTITKSDVLGQFMPLVGVDWSQTGVANLFCAIKENGYQMLFLSARSISQSYHTRRFLFSIKQDGKTLPEGPVVISPDGLFPSLYREVIRRAPHEFKITCLEDIKALFPADCQPFYAGFGNRITDEISYVKVGIPKGKIFIINPKGEVSVHRRVDRKSYHSLHDLVHGMFPSIITHEQEDFNSWNYWRLPSPFSDI